MLVVWLDSRQKHAGMTIWYILDDKSRLSAAL